MGQELFLDCRGIQTWVMDRRFVQVPQLGMAELGFPTCPVPSPVPSMVFWVQVLCFSSQHLTLSRGSQQGFPEWDRSLSLSRLDKASQVGGQAGAGMSSNHPGNSSAGLGTAPPLPCGYRLTSLGPQRERPSI